MDIIAIRELEVFFHIGVTESERRAAQRLLITVEIGCDMSGAAASDNLEATIDYDRLCQRLRMLGEDRSWQLIEALAGEIADLILEDDRAQEVTVEVKKFCLPQTDHVAVRLTRERATP